MDEENVRSTFGACPGRLHGRIGPVVGDNLIWLVAVDFLTFSRGPWDHDLMALFGPSDLRGMPRSRVSLSAEPLYMFLYMFGFINAVKSSGHLPQIDELLPRSSPNQ